MRTFNQVVTVVVLLILLVLLPIIATIPDAVVGAVQDATFAIEPWVATTTGRVVIGVVAAVLWLLTIWLLWREFRRDSDREVRVTEIEGGRAQVDSASVAKLLEQRVAAVPSVRRVTAKVRQTREGVVADLVLATADGVMVPEVTRLAISRARQALEQEIGAKVADVDVRVREVGLGEAAPVAVPPPTVTRPEEEAPLRPMAEPETYAAEEMMPSMEEPATEPLIVEAPEEPYEPAPMAESSEEWEPLAPETEETDVIYGEPPAAPYSEPAETPYEESTEEPYGEPGEEPPLSPLEGEEEERSQWRREEE